MNKTPEIPNPSFDLINRASLTRKSASLLAQLSNEERRDALMSMAEALQKKSSEIVLANEEDLQESVEEGLSQSLLSRLKLNSTKLEGAIEGLKKVAFLPDPIGSIDIKRELSDGLILERTTVPLGVLGVIFEARPDALIQIASLAIRSGNGALLKGGREAKRTNKEIMSALQAGLRNSSVAETSLCLLTTRQESLGLLHMDKLVDLIIPRGSNELVRFIQENTRIPVLGHADGICHLFVDKDAHIDQAISIAIDSKTQYPAACNAIETLILHQDVAKLFLDKAVPAFENMGVTLLGDKTSQSLGISRHATESDWAEEYLDLKLSVKVVASLKEATDHIQKYGSRHTDGIVTGNIETAEKFLNEVDSSGVFHNCSTRFADGFRYGLGAEVGISTQTLPPRGPVGLEGLVTYKYKLRGGGHLASDFASGDKSFTHKDVDLD